MANGNASMASYIVPFKREIWEYQKSFVGTFAGISFFAFIVLVYGLFRFSGFVEGSEDFHITIEGTISSPKDFNFQAASASYLSFMTTISFIVSVYYLLSCLYDDRKDRSILFWKSMPVSETQNLITKFLTGLFVIPFIALGIGFVSLVINTLAIGIWVPNILPLSFGAILSSAELFSALWYQVVFILLSAIWLAPFFAWLMLASSFSSKSPFLIAFVPPLLLTAAEGMLFGSTTLFDFIKAFTPDLEMIGRSQANTKLLLQAHLDIFLQGRYMIIGLVMTLVFMAGAVWMRNNRYEI